MRCELLVALPFVVPLHLFNRVAHNRPRGLESPRASVACPALKILAFHPYQLATPRLHGTPRNWCGYALGKGQTIAIGTVCCLSDIQHRQELLSQSQIVLKLLNHAVTFTSGDL